jgi:hypothetical protein
LRLVALHKATTKLAYISAAIFSTLLLDGYCAPNEEGKAVEGGGSWGACCSLLARLLGAGVGISIWYGWVGCGGGDEEECC